MKDWIKTKIYSRFPVSHSKSGDDIQLYKLLNTTTPGAYLDVGCWKPKKHSNTYFFYLRQWKGICVDPNPEFLSLYKNTRPKDIMLNCAVSNATQPRTYYLLEEPYSSMNTLDYQFIKSHNLEAFIKEEIQVPSYSIASILKTHLNKNERLDFFDIDVEGLDLEVLKTNDWVSYRPKIVMVESNVSIEDDTTSEITKYLKSVNYKLIGKSSINGNLGNLFFINNNI